MTKINNAQQIDYIRENASKIAEKLLDWYGENKRDLPWRRNHDPYSIWISEVMLQQTQVGTVIDYFIDFMKKFPTVKDLAEASEDEVLKAWTGLGYYSRAKRLKQTAVILQEKYDGLFPKDFDKVIKLPGIGPYTAGAILSIAYNLRFPAVDGNVLRVFSRLFNDHRDIGDTKTQQSFEEVALKLLPADCRHFNQGLMELGSQVCLPKNPRCEICPVHSLCLSHQYGCEKLLPFKKARVKNIQLDMEVAWVEYNNLILIIKRPSEGLLASLWGFPIIERNLTLQEGLSIKEELEVLLGTTVELLEPLKKAKHVFSHRTWNMTLYRFKAFKKIIPDTPETEWIDLQQLRNYPFPTAFKKLVP